MKVSIFAFFCIFLACNSQKIHYNEYILKVKYCTNITVGGFLGVQEKCFEKNEKVVAESVNDSVIMVRIAPHSKINEGEPSNTSYQELVEIPIKYLQKAD